MRRALGAEVETTAATEGEPTPKEADHHHLDQHADIKPLDYVLVVLTDVGNSIIAAADPQAM